MGLLTGYFSLVGIQDVVSYEYIYKLTQYNSVPDTPVSTNADGSVPEGWSSQLLGVSASLPYLWESRRLKKDSYVARDISSGSFIKENYRIGTNGVASYAYGYSYSAALDLPEGQTIEVLTAGTGFAVIARYTNGSYASLVDADGTLDESKMYTYTAETDCQVVISVYHLSSYSARITSGTWSAWSTPVLKSSWGRQGAKLRMRDWAAGTAYLSGADGEDFYDVVIYEGKLYLCTKTHTAKAGDNDPITSINGYKGFWESAQEWTFVATKLLLADKIKAEQIDADGIVAKNVDLSGKITATSGSIDNVTVSSISSKNGTFAIDAEGNTTISNLTASGGSFNDINVDGLTAVNVDISGKITATSGSIQNVTVKSINSSASDFYIDENGNVKIKDLTAEGGTFTNIEVDGLNAVNVDISGKVIATSGKIGGWSISGNNLECEGFDTKILVEASGTRFMRINAEEKIMCYVRSDESTGISIAVYGNTDDAVGLKVLCNSMGKGYAIKSSGNVLLNAREGERVELYGLTVNVRKVSSSSNFTLQTNDDFIEFNNASAMTFNMSSNSKKGKVVYMKKISTGANVTLTGGFRNPDGVGVSTTLTIGDEKSRIFVYDGSYWVQFYCG